MKKLVFCFLLMHFQVLEAQQTIIKVHAGEHTRAGTPVYVQLAQTSRTKVDYYLLNTVSGRKLPVQWIDSNTMVFIVDSIVAGFASSYRLQHVALKTKAHPVVTEKQGHGIVVKVNSKPVLFYHTRKAQPAPDSPLYYQRSGFFHPLYSPGGKILTDDFPVGHMHQHGIFQAWVNTTFRASPVDFWNQHKQTGNVEHAELMGIKEGPVLTELTVRLSHQSRLHGEILAEIMKVRIYPFSNYFLFDIESEQRNITRDTLFLNQYHYGGMAFRGSSQWNPDDSKHFQNKWKVVTSEGLEDTLADNKHARWVNASGIVDGHRAGVSIFDHPSNYHYPQAIRVHPRMPYWCYVPVADGGIDIKPGGVFYSRYRYLVYDGDVPLRLIKMTEKNWVDPPRVEVQLTPGPSLLRKEGRKKRCCCCSLYFLPPSLRSREGGKFIPAHHTKFQQDEATFSPCHL